MELPIVASGIAGGLFFLFCSAFVVSRFYRQVDQGRALIINPFKGEPVVTFTGSIVWPIINRAEVMDISLKTVEIDRRGKEGLICKDNIRADIKVTFFVRVNKTREDVLKVAQSIGCARASDENTLEHLFEAKFSEALKTVGKSFDFEELYTHRDAIKDQVVQVIGRDLSGYMLEDCAIDFLEQTPVDMLDKHNILDAQGIRKITELTSVQNVHTNEFRQSERMAITKRNVEADEAIFALERQRTEAAAKQKREIESIQARETAEAERVKSEEYAKQQLARIKAEEEVQINDQNKMRQVEVAQKNRERVVGVEAERVEKDRALEAINREREVELSRIGKEKQLEGEKKAIADVVRARIAVEKTVAEEEERIKDLRVKAEATRKKDALLITAEAQAQEKLVKDIKAAEASNEVSKFTAKEKLTLAEAELQASDMTAKAKMRLSEGIQAEEAALGLAAARVKEADALAQEKQGLAAVRVQEAETAVIEKQGLVKASVIEKQGLAEANIAREKLIAEAAGEKEKGLARASIGEAEAHAIQKRGEAEAIAIREKLLAEAKSIEEKLLAEARGLAEKAESMKLLQGATREHEEFRLRLQKERDVELASIHVRRDIAEHQAKVLAETMGHAKINIVGGDGQFFERFIKAISVGQAVDGALDQSETLKQAFAGYLNGQKDLSADLKDILSKPGLTSDAQNLAMAALLHRMAPAPTTAAASNLKSLVESEPAARASAPERTQG
ncbi:Inner membrane protein YqiK [Cystobacter fuscus DSM 2262]|uniref:Inner membrane protein YqiK n=1 Tax=Cystobacter fuscus (strain ATCC 25194 / DSM 2262 / NBRC 100088 / M29) TaxID=1242864 RepID=S9NZR8_CYSF2|nr:flotillin family protein [Cystobacter fuscus]EPX56371.1 Inner membrane protein YqiK [Cystobacter fuscus DSM 2262]